eukprot:3472151-Pleurochrysis_carterae.AAC.2
MHTGIGQPTEEHRCVSSKRSHHIKALSPRQSALTTSKRSHHIKALAPHAHAACCMCMLQDPSMRPVQTMALSEPAHSVIFAAEICAAGLLDSSKAARKLNLSQTRCAPSEVCVEFCTLSRLSAIQITMQTCSM